MNMKPVMDKTLLKSKKLELIQELDNEKNELKRMLDKAKSFRENIDMFTPEMFKKKEGEKLDFREKGKYNKFEAKENIKAVSEILNTELNIHTRIESLIKTQYELMQRELKLDDLENSAGNISNLEDILKFTKQIKEDPDLEKSLADITQRIKS